MFFLSYQLCTYYLNVIFNLAYQTRDIICRGLYTLDPLFEANFIYWIEETKISFPD